MQKRDDARIAGQGVPFNDKIHEWTDSTITPFQLAELNAHFKLRLQGNPTTKLQVMRTTVIKDTFRVVNTKKYHNLDYTSKADFKALNQSTLKGNKKNHKGSTDYGTVHNSMLRLILYDPLIVKIMKKGFTLDDIIH
eukprot:1625124-Rhodomonas_salina.2